ncbi:hypothetical protein JHK82_024469 [Glycine max]|nr:hypothetical protein JHK87_024447 [Glycine soja]KAG5006521.1 hypothetical protein JHK85_025063 [Glycine max]KAG5012302.1 hypothetical protein JHK86_024563 [Glycine max]KAG5133281.1 hypothetical protein JHK82_024469 [Glycine max]
MYKKMDSESFVRVSSNGTRVSSGGDRVKITNEEFSDWCKPWKGSLMVILLGKKIGFCMMETNLNIVWAIKGSIKIIDVPRNYFQVLFTFDEEYNHPLMEGP